MASALCARATRARRLVCCHASYMTSCAWAIASSVWRPPIADTRPSMARRSGSLTTADLPFADGGLGFFRRGFFDTGIGPLLILRHAALLRRAALPIILEALHTSIAECVCPPFVRFLQRRPEKSCVCADHRPVRPEAPPSAMEMRKPR